MLEHDEMQDMCWTKCRKWLRNRQGSDQSICTWLKNLFGVNVSARSWSPQAGREKFLTLWESSPAAEHIVIIYKLIRLFSSIFLCGLINDSDAAEMYPWEFLVVSFPVSQCQNVSRLLHGACVCRFKLCIWGT